ncbi:MAG: isochorismate synthase [Bacillales bacterium]|jgi:menaquinone-specific isochorismate synthase|nr:isochorismate synthase [Bacillales bacterium]
MTIKLEINIKNSLINARSLAADQSVVFCHVQKIESMSVIELYKSSEFKYRGKRFYWGNADQNLKLLGIDTAFKLQMDETEDDRFELVENFWNSFSKLIQLSGEQSVEGTGPICFGGFSFQPNQSDMIWEDFGTLLFYVPKFLITDIKGECYLSSTFVMNADTTDSEIEDFVQEYELILRQEDSNEVYPNIIDTVETDVVEWTEMIENALAEIKSGNIEKIVLARVTELNFDREVSPSSVMEKLSTQQNNSYQFGIELDQVAFVGASPERLIFKQGNTISTACIAGTIGRGETEGFDKMLEIELMNDSKNIHEHHFVVEYIRSILEEKCVKLDISNVPQILKNKNVQHLFTPVIGQALPDKSILDFVRDLHPTPAMGGIPHTFALEKIDTLESFGRGFYASPIGWMDRFGNGEFIVGIRSALINQNRVTLFAGCGIVANSDPLKEYEETAMKLKPMLSALGL